MTLEAALAVMFLADSDCVTTTPGKLWPLSLPDKTADYPAIVRVTLGRRTLKIYDHPGRDALCESHVRFITQIPGRTKYLEAYAASEALRLMLEGYKGDLTGSGGPTDTIHIDGVFLHDYRELFEDETQMNLIVSEYLISHTQTIRNT